MLPTWVESRKKSVMPWVVLVVSPAEDWVLATTLLPDEPTSDSLWDVLAETIKKPVSGTAHRPTRIRIEPDPRWEVLRPHLAEIGIELRNRRSNGASR